MQPVRINDSLTNIAARPSSIPDSPAALKLAKRTWPAREHPPREAEGPAR
ncbi:MULTISPECIES: hypothetical protein [Streptomyces]|nr:hypothetical protein [Streptomyces brevispora]